MHRFFILQYILNTIPYFEAIRSRIITDLVIACVTIWDQIRHKLRLYIV